MIIETTKGPMDTSLLIEKKGTIDNEVELTHWVEYWLDGELIHRSVNMTLKQAAVYADGSAASFA
jgi:hypothetical protein